MTQPNGLHHVAISTGDIKQQIEYFSDVLGMELVALYWMHGVENTFHGFMKLGDEAVAFVFKEENKGIDTVLDRCTQAIQAMLQHPARCSTWPSTSIRSTGCWPCATVSALKASP